MCSYRWSFCKLKPHNYILVAILYEEPLCHSLTCHVRNRFLGVVAQIKRQLKQSYCSMTLLYPDCRQSCRYIDAKHTVYKTATEEQHNCRKAAWNLKKHIFLKVLIKLKLSVWSITKLPPPGCRSNSTTALVVVTIVINVLTTSWRALAKFHRFSTTGFWNKHPPWTLGSGE